RTQSARSVTRGAGSVNWVLGLPLVAYDSFESPRSETKRERIPLPSKRPCRISYYRIENRGIWALIPIRGCRAFVVWELRPKGPRPDESKTALRHRIDGFFGRASKLVQ